MGCTAASSRDSHRQGLKERDPLASQRLLELLPASSMARAEEPATQPTLSHLCNAPKTTRAQLWSYERVALVSVRAQQLANGAPTTLIRSAEVACLGPRQLAERELQEGCIPLVVVRRLPSGDKEYWRPGDLLLQHVQRGTYQG